MNKALKITGGLLLAATIVFALFHPGEVKTALQGFLNGLENSGPIGMALYGLVYILACIFFLPGSVLTLGAGAVYGIIQGTILVSISSVLGASAAFLLGRTLLRSWITRKVEGNARFAAIDHAVGREGFKIVLLVRLSPVFPFNLLNYLFGLTRVSFWNHLFASWIGMLPGTIMYVALGAGIGGIFSSGGAGQKILLYVGLAATIVVTVFITRIARRALSKALPEVAEEQTQPSATSA